MIYIPLIYVYLPFETHKVHWKLGTSDMNCRMEKGIHAFREDTKATSILVCYFRFGWPFSVLTPGISILDVIKV
ncbi:CIC11C00000002799 [Sungouiella intermedia]|uniref:CIC11C00000002799 n=1 Tax=Sungouiella intermedia TaxID=45354 RepID=A0A1L0BBJ5_9ASCO|nr:CIC11C00000002799 [[Candida] intermedia]